jgi:hypothetical protein
MKQVMILLGIVMLLVVVAVDKEIVQTLTPKVAHPQCHLDLL